MHIKLISIVVVAATVLVASATPFPDPRGNLDASLWGSANSRNSWSTTNSYIYSSDSGSSAKQCSQGDKGW
ncbi:hypothetical protein F5890DRAFT_1542942 [Lentinula detonsa]|uniref:Uncharacterized protein n=1 Tax=Lentinula detonsa TaxID=2804962 RepID=A0AA38PRW6_9AGAR|nr:hypothetical protein F5890DRAFT_1542942 [Lentinula detonsa]